MSQNKVVRNGIIAMFILAITMACALVIGLNQPQPLPNNEPTVTVKTAEFYAKINDVLAMIDDQSKVDQQLSALNDDASFTLEDPYILVNPYKISPLTAIVYFYSETETKVTVHVEGELIETSLSFSSTDFEKNHWVPVYGLYAGKDNEVTLTTTDKDGVSKTAKLQIGTEPLNKSLSTNIINTFHENGLIEEGFTFSYSNGHFSNLKSAFDQEGEYRWYLDKEWTMAGSFNNGESIITGYGDFQGDVLLIEMTYFGKIKSVYFSPYGLHHDVAVTDQKLIVTGSNNVPNTIEDFIYSIDRSNGTILDSVDYKHILLRTRHFGVNYLLNDWMHINSVVAYDDKMIVSSNYQNLIIKNDWQGNVDWILGDPIGFTTEYQKLLLKPIGDPFEYPYNQHNATVLPDADQDPKTIDLMVFDNGASRNAFNPTYTDQALYSRIVVYRIDESNHTVRQLWQYGKERLELYSSARGGAMLLNNGNTLGVFTIDEEKDKVKTNHAVYVEVDPAGNVIWEAVASSSNSSNLYIEYKAERYQMYNAVTYRFDLNADASVFLPENLMKNLNEYNQSLSNQ